MPRCAVCTSKKLSRGDAEGAEVVQPPRPPRLRVIITSGSLALRQQLLDEIERARIVRLSQPEQGALSDFGVLAGAHDANERRDSFLVALLREGEDGLLA